MPLSFEKVKKLSMLRQNKFGVLTVSINERAWEDNHHNGVDDKVILREYKSIV